MKLGKFAEALEDAEKALSLEKGSYMALHWKGIALFYCGDFANAKLSFEESIRAQPDAKVARSLWIRKCDAELSGSTLPLGGIVGEVSKAQPSSASAPVSTPASASSAAPAAATEKEAKAVKQDAAPKDLTISGRKPIKREWYQNNTTVFITIFKKEVKQEDITVDFKEKELSLTIKLPGEEDLYTLDLDLADAIDPATSKVETSKTKVEVALAKKNIGLQWRDLEKQAAMASAPAYPSSSKTKRDWGKIDQDIDAELKQEKPEGDAALNKLFKEIYEKADDDTRRAMNKSFQTSGGTVLSTNWGEVGKADYEGKDRPTAPEGQEWKDQRGDDKVPDHVTGKQ